MSKYNRREWQALTVGVAQQMPALCGSVILLDTDGMDACIAQRSDTGSVNILAVCDGEGSEDFYAVAAQRFQCDAQTVFEACRDAQKQWKRLLRRSGKSDDGAAQTLGFATYVQMLELYNERFALPLKTAVQTVRSKAGERVPLVLLGRLAAFYPAEHTVREELSLMPFAPVVEGLVTAPALAVDCRGLIDSGTVILQELENAKKRVAHTITLQAKRRSVDGLADWLHIFAQKGSDPEEWRSPQFSDVILVSANEPLTLFADSTPYTVYLPKEAFANAPSAAVQLALGIREETPVLLVRTQADTFWVAIDEKMYKEDV